MEQEQSLKLIDYLREGHKPYMNIDVVIKDIIAKGDKVAVQCMFHLDIKTGQTTLAVMGFFQFYEDRIVKIWPNIVIRDEQEKISN